MKSSFIFLKKNQQLEGIKLCSLRTKGLLDDANKLIASEGSLTSALALYIFAVEEYGKGKLLQEFVSEPVCLIDKKKFTNHEYKIKVGLDNLDTFCKKIELSVTINVATDKTMTVRARKTKYYLDDLLSIPTNMTGSFETVGYEPTREVIRWGCIFTDFDEINQRWFIETIPNRNDLLKAITNFTVKL